MVQKGSLGGNLKMDHHTILVVDDVKSIRESLSYSLDKAGYTMLTASGGPEAIELIHQHNVDLVISDISMPLMSGIELVKLIKELYRPPEILLITGEPSLETATSAIRLGIFDYITKPVNMDSLKITVHRALERKVLLDEKEHLEDQNQRYLRDLEHKLDERSYNLLQTEEKYRGLFENSNVGVGVSTIEGKILEANARMCQMTGYSPKDLKQLSFLETFVDPSAKAKLQQNMLENKHIDSIEVGLTRANGSTYWVNLSVKNIKYRGKSACLITNIDITDRKENEFSLKRALADHEEMLREIHHRTKNNMNVIISLLNMQAQAINDDKVRRILDAMTDRIFSMSLVHEQVYASKSLSSISLRQYVDSLLRRHSVQKKKQNGNILVTLDVDDVTIGLSQAIPLGLALNEIFSNVFLHPFCDETDGNVLIKLECSQNSTISMTIKDDGCGLPDHMNISDPGSLGLHMAKILVEDQLGGLFTLESNQGTIVKIEFPLEQKNSKD